MLGTEVQTLVLSIQQKGGSCSPCYIDPGPMLEADPKKHQVQLNPTY